MLQLTTVISPSCKKSIGEVKKKEISNCWEVPETPHLSWDLWFIQASPVHAPVDRDWCQLCTSPYYFHGGRVQRAVALGPSSSSGEAGSGWALRRKQTKARGETACRYPAASTHTLTPPTHTPFTPQEATQVSPQLAGITRTFYGARDTWNRDGLDWIGWNVILVMWG